MLQQALGRPGGEEVPTHSPAVEEGGGGAVEPAYAAQHTAGGAHAKHQGYKKHSQCTRGAPVTPGQVTTKVWKKSPGCELEATGTAAWSGAAAVEDMGSCCI